MTAQIPPHRCHEIVFNPTLQANINALTSCQNANGNINVMISPAGNYTWLWSNGYTTKDIDSSDIRHLSFDSLRRQ